jgi:hypothetical protein
VKVQFVAYGERNTRDGGKLSFHFILRQVCFAELSQSDLKAYC